MLPAQLGLVRREAAAPLGRGAHARHRGRYDWVVPVVCSETIADLIPNSELVIFEGVGHSPQFEERELLQQTIREFMHRAVPVAKGAEVMTTYVVIGAGAIGGTLGAHAARAGHDVLVLRRR